jgi:hypothetical protein
MSAVVVLLAVILAWLSFLSFLFVRYFHRSNKPVLPLSSVGLRINLVRFNPFSDTGGEQSFVLSLLDGGGNGILLTSLHGRGITRVYAKRVIAGKTDQELSAEEKTALSKTLNT